MNERAIRLRKGISMGAMFAGFMAGMFVVLLVMVPFNWLLNLLLPKGRRIERWVRVGFRSWLRTLGYLGLVRQIHSRGSPYDGPCVVVCNHPGLFDVLFLITEIPRLCVLVKPSLPRVLPLAPILRSLGYVLAPDYAQVDPMESARGAMAEIRAGNKLQIFPEGTRSPEGGLLPFRPGAFKIARMTGVPVQPVFIRNHPPFLPKEDNWYYPRKETSMFRLEFWDPLPPPPKGQERAMARELEMRYRKAIGI
jgi:1-acyl-sn-glycerol-3-phosphate acyltransferase